MEIELGKYQNTNCQKFKRLVWECVWLFVFRLTPRWCLNGWRRAVLRAFGARLDAGCRIQGGVKCWQPWRLYVGRNSWIDGGVNLYSVDNLTIGANAVISVGAFLCTATHDIASPDFALKTEPIHVGDMAWIGAYAFVLPGVKIGEGAVVGACSVVTKDVEPWSVVAGNPARKIGMRTVRA